MTCVARSVSMRTTPSLGAVTVIVPTDAMPAPFGSTVLSSVSASATACAVTSVPSENL